MAWTAKSLEVVSPAASEWTWAASWVSILAHSATDSWPGASIEGDSALVVWASDDEVVFWVVETGSVVDEVVSLDRKRKGSVRLYTDLAGAADHGLLLTCSANCAANRLVTALLPLEEEVHSWYESMAVFMQYAFFPGVER